MSNTVEIILKGTDLTGPAFTGAIRQMRDIEKAASSMFATFVGGAAIGAVGSLAALGIHSVELADEMGRLAQKAGLPVEQFSQVAFSAKLADVSVESLQKGFKGLSEEMVKQGRGGEDLLQQMLAQADAFKEMKDGADKVNLAVKLFGRTGQDLIPLLNQGSAAIREQMQEADRLGLTISKDFADDARKFDENIKILKGSVAAFGNAIAKEALPHLLELQTYLLDTGKNSRSLESDLTRLMLMWEGAKTFDWMGFLKGPVPPKGQRPIDILGKQADDLMKGAPEPGKPDFPAVTVTPVDPIEDHSNRFHDSIQLMIDDTKKFDLERLTSFDKEKERLGQELQARVDSYAAAFQSNEEFIQMSELAAEAYHDRVVQIEKDIAKQRAQIAGQVVDQLGSTLGSMASLAASFGKKNFVLTQVLRSGEAVMHTAAGVTRALAAFDPPVNFVMAGLVAAEGAAQIAMIAAQKPPAAHGGLDFVPAETTYLLQRGERVLSPNQNRDLTEALDSGWSGDGNGPVHIHVHMGSQEIGTFIWDGSRDGTVVLHPRAIRESV